jgi:hypothetical protein
MLQSCGFPQVAVQLWLDKHDPIEDLLNYRIAVLLKRCLDLLEFELRFLVDLFLRLLSGSVELRAVSARETKLRTKYKPWLRTP